MQLPSRAPERALLSTRKPTEAEHWKHFFSNPKAKLLLIEYTRNEFGPEFRRHPKLLFVSVYDFSPFATFPYGVTFAVCSRKLSKAEMLDLSKVHSLEAVPVFVRPYNCVFASQLGTKLGITVTKGEISMKPQASPPAPSTFAGVVTIPTKLQLPKGRKVLVAGVNISALPQELLHNPLFRFRSLGEAKNMFKLPPDTAYFVPFSNLPPSDKERLEEEAKEMGAHIISANWTNSSFKAWATVVSVTEVSEGVAASADNTSQTDRQPSQCQSIQEVNPIVEDSAAKRGTVKPEQQHSIQLKEKPVDLAIPEASIVADSAKEPVQRFVYWPGMGVADFVRENYAFAESILDEKSSITTLLGALAEKLGVNKHSIATAVGLYRKKNNIPSPATIYRSITTAVERRMKVILSLGTVEESSFKVRAKSSKPQRANGQQPEPKATTPSVEVSNKPQPNGVELATNGSVSTNGHKTGGKCLADKLMDVVDKLTECADEVRFLVPQVRELENKPKMSAEDQEELKKLRKMYESLVPHFVQNSSLM